MDEYSIVEIFEGPSEGHRCGYCKSNDGSLSYGMWAHSLTVKNYQDLIDRGWRRSGKYCYRPLMQQTCCPQYTIRCCVADFKLSKSQKKILRRMHRFLSVGHEQHPEKNFNNSEVDGSLGSLNDMDVAQIMSRAAEAEKFMDDKRLDTSLINNDTANLKTSSSEEPTTSDAKTKGGEEFRARTLVTSPSQEKLPAKDGLWANADNKPLRKKAKLLRMERKMEKMSKKAEKCTDQTKNQEMQKQQSRLTNVAKTLRDYLEEPLPPNAAHSLEVITLRCWPQSGEFRASADESYSVYRQYQSRVHNESDDADCDGNTYSEFLVESPLKAVAAAGSHPGYGSFHQQYWLDGKLIAVGVVDILPACVSSVYFYYDPQYGFLSLGTYGALREIAYAQELLKVAPEMRFYYMGFYIHTCVKMRYKGQFEPSYLLCPEVSTWHPIDKARVQLDAKPYSRLEERSNIEDEDAKVGLKDVMVLHRRAALMFVVYDALRFRRRPEEAMEVLEYARHIGKKCVGRTLLYRK